MSCCAAGFQCALLCGFCKGYIYIQLHTHILLYPWKDTEEVGGEGGTGEHLLIPMKALEVISHCKEAVLPGWRGAGPGQVHFGLRRWEHMLHAALCGFGSTQGSIHRGLCSQMPHVPLVQARHTLCLLPFLNAGDLSFLPARTTGQGAPWS